MQHRVFQGGPEPRGGSFVEKAECECEIPYGYPMECGEQGGEDGACPCPCHDDMLYSEPSPNGNLE